MLMTSAEEKVATVRQDNNIFAGGMAGAFASLVKNTWAGPFMLARRVFGEKTESVLEPGARIVGRLAGRLAQPILAAGHTAADHALEDTLKATVLAENLTGIYGENYYINDKRVVRRVHTCPFRDKAGAKILCHLGEAAGQELFQELVPGIKHKVHVTMARGHTHCEYSYEID